MTREEMLNNLTQAQNAAPQESVTQPAPDMGGNQPIARRSRTDELRRQMQTNQQAGTPTVSVQGDNYNPVGTATPHPTIVTNNQTPLQNNTTVINTTTMNNNNGGGTGNPFKSKIGVIIAAVVTVVIVIAGCYATGIIGGSPESTEVTENSEEELEWIDPDEIKFAYTAEELSELRAAGYTADEIEMHYEYQTSAAQLIEEAKTKQQEWYQENVVNKFDTNSEAFNDYIKNTWLSLPERNDMAEWTDIAGYYVIRKNLDYEKIPVHGNQLFLKIFLDDASHTDYMFLNVSPEEWIKLNESGNVIVEYTYATRLLPDPDYEGSFVEDTNSMYIIDATLEIIE